MRLFIALPLDDQVRTMVADLEARLQEAGTGRFVDPQNLHITLAFLGEQESTLPVEEVLQSLPFPECCVRIEGFHFFHRTLTLAVQADQALLEYVDLLRNRLREKGIDFDAKPFRAHVTLARKFETQALPPQPEPVTMPADRVVLYSSRFEEGRRIYTDLFSVSC